MTAFSGPSPNFRLSFRKWYLSLGSVFAIVCVVSGTAFSQPVLTLSAVSELYQVGTETYSAFDAAGTTFDMGIPGATGTVFHFDSYAFSSAPVMTTLYESPGGYPFDYRFPEATHVSARMNGTSFYNCSYFQLLDSALLYLGDASGTESVLFSFQRYSPPMPLYRLPMQFGDSLYYDGERLDSAGLSVGAMRMSYAVLSAGTLQSALDSTPVLTLRRIMRYIDSSRTSGVVSQRLYARYEFLSEDGACSQISIDTFFVYAQHPYVNSVYHVVKRIPDGISGASEYAPHLQIAALYPHPAHTAAGFEGVLTTPAGAFVEVGLYDILGRPLAVLYRGNPENGTIHFRSGTLEAGTYLLRATGERGCTSRVVTVLK